MEQDPSLLQGQADVMDVVVADKVEALKKKRMSSPGPCSSRSGSRYSMSRTCGPQDIISLVIPRLGDNRTIQGQRAIALIDGGATHNFIDASLVSRRALQTEEFEGFDVAVADGHTVECLDRVPHLEIKLGNYTVRNTFYVVDLSDTDVVLGVQWMITLGKITTNYQTLEIGFRDNDRKRVVLRGMSTGVPRTVSAKRIERIFRYGEVAYATECLITMRKDLKDRQQYQTEIRNLLGQHQQVFGS
jgi:hypothetical protein